MSIAITGAQPWQNGNKEIDIRYDTVGATSTTFTNGDPLTLSSGILTVAGATSTIVGTAVKTQTLSSTNDTVAKVRPGYVPVDNSTIFLMGTNADLAVATAGGTYYKLSGTTGAIVVDVTSGVMTTTARIVEIVQVDPMNLGGTGAGSGLRTCLVRFVKTPYTNISITA